MQLEFAFDVLRTPGSQPQEPPVSTRNRRRANGSQNYHGGLAAEDSVVRHYGARGAVLLDHRYRTEAGEIDLVLEADRMIVFVEVKRRRKMSPWDSPVSRAQWRRLEQAAIQYMFEYKTKTGVQSFCRFDVALVGPDGSVRIVENARSFDD